MSLRIVAIADTHGKHWSLDVPDGDILLHAGDMTFKGSIDDVKDFNVFLGQLPHPVKVAIAGNHDFCFERDREGSATALTNAIYLQDQSVAIEGIRFYGSPWQPWFYDWAFNLHRGPEIRAKWELIPKETDILITHGPPYGHGDQTFRGELVGCRDLLEVVELIRPRFHIFGHIHEGAGVTADDHTTFINASSCDQHFRLVNEPTVFVFETE
jgi:Icc-related predicted phosphoesterase